MSSSVAIRDLQKRFDGHSDDGVLALTGINLEIAPAEFVAVVGPSGCGKSTLLRIIAGLIAPSEGEVLVDDRPVGGQPVTDIGIVFQDPVLFDWKSVIDNILLQAKVRRLDRERSKQTAIHLLRKVGLDGFQHRRPYELSGGMRQRVAVCRALVHRPPLLLMDEPFGALDALTREQMTNDLQVMWVEHRPTVFFVTHSIPEAALLADRIIVMSARPGEIVGEVKVTLPRPRILSDVSGDPNFIGPMKEVRQLLNLTPAPIHAEL